MTERTRFEVVIVGGGIAGAALAYFLSERGIADVLILEREGQPGTHATGRSAATLVEWDPVPALQELKALATPFLRTPPPGFCAHPLLDPAGILVTFQDPAWSAVQAVLPLMERRGTTMQILSPAQVLERVPVVDLAYVDGGVWLPTGGHIDVHELLWSYLRHAGARGVERRCGVAVRGVRVERGHCRAVVTDAGEIPTRWVVNAAGAWAGEIAALAGAAPISITPCRRHIITFAAPEGLDARRWPLYQSESYRLYFKPESGGFLACPMDEDPMQPCDAQPDELIVAQAMQRVAMLAPALAPKTLRRKWAGLRTFAPDRVLVIGEDPLVQGFFWLAGQGGCGIETSPAYGPIAADLLLDGRTERVDAAIYAPARFTAS